MLFCWHQICDKTVDTQLNDRIVNRTVMFSIIIGHTALI